MQIRSEFQDAVQQLNTFETHVGHLHENFKSDWTKLTDAQNELETVLVHNGEQLKSTYDQVAHDYQMDLSPHISQFRTRLYRERKPIARCKMR